MYALTNMQIRGSKIQSVFGKHTSKDISLLQHGDDFVMLADENDLEWFAKQLNEALIEKVRGVLGGDRGDFKTITLLSRIMRYGQTMNGWPFLAWEADPSTWKSSSCAEATKTLSAPGIKRSMDEVNNATELSEDHARTHRSMCVRINHLAQETGHLVCSQDVSAKHTGVASGKEMRSVLVGKPRMVQRFVTQPPVDTVSLKVDSDHVGCSRTEDPQQASQPITESR